jgi:hypothetical protein
MECFGGANCAFASMTITFARPPCGLTYHVEFQAQLQYCATVRTDMYRWFSRVGPTYLRSNNIPFFELTVPCLAPSPSPAPPPLTLPPAETIFGHTVVHDTSALRRALSGVAPNSRVALYLPPAAVFRLGGTPLHVTNIELSLRSDADGATIDAQSLSRAFEVHGGTLHLHTIHVANGRANTFGGGILVVMDGTLLMEVPDEI